MSKSILILAFVSMAGLAPAQTFQTGSRLVVVDVVVQGQDGSPVKGLTKDDFTIEDKGKKVDIRVFEVAEAGKSATQPIQINAMIGTNRLNSKGETQPTATVVVYDKVNNASADQGFMRTQVLNLLAGLRDTDRIGFYAIGFGLIPVHEFDEEAAPLVRAAKHMQQGGAVDALPAADRPVFQALEAALTPMQELQNQAKVNISYPAFRAIANHLEGVPGRKNVLWIASRFPLTYGSGVERRSDDEKEMQAFTNVLTNAGVSLYPIDPRGSGAGLNNQVERSTDGAVLRSIGTNQANSLAGNQGFRQVAEATGGEAFFNTNDLAAAVREVVNAASYVYVLGFSPEEKSLDGKVHKLDVKVAKKAETDKAEVAYRREYVAWGPKSSLDVQMRQTVAQVFTEPIDASALNLMGVANPDQAKPGFHRLDVRLNLGELQVERVGEKIIGAFEMAIAPDGAQGKNAISESFNLNMTQEQYQGALTNGLVVGKSIQTAGANGRFHIVVQDKGSGKVGSMRVPYLSPPGTANAAGKQ